MPQLFKSENWLSEVTQLAIYRVSLCCKVKLLTLEIPQLIHTKTDLKSHLKAKDLYGSLPTVRKQCFVPVHQEQCQIRSGREVFMSGVQILSLSECVSPLRGGVSGSSALLCQDSQNTAFKDPEHWCKRGKSTVGVNWTLWLLRQLSSKYLETPNSSSAVSSNLEICDLEGLPFPL